jgi:hypothetical protein
VTRKIAPFRKLAQQNPLPPLMLVLGVLLAGAMAKLGHVMLGTGGMLAFYPTYLVMLGIGQGAAGLLARLNLPQRALHQHP